MISSPDSPSSTNNDSETTIEKEPREPSPLFKEFIEKQKEYPSPEEKILHGLQFMRSSISQEGSPHFREFWEARRLILPLFKENLNPAIRSNLWNEYIELTVEARRLKEILEEESLFAMEQIDLAITALVDDLGRFDELLKNSLELTFQENSSTIQAKEETYRQIQKELNLLNTFATRLNSMRKEVVKTDMRIRFKTKFFKRLSDLGDQIFPRRKELIEKVSQEFEKDVETFIEKHFPENQGVKAPYYALREEIKALQSVAKSFTLNSGVFTRTRVKLSKCWDEVKGLEKEHKKEVQERRQASSEERKNIEVKIGELKEKTEGLTLDQVNREIEVISQEMRNVTLSRDDVKDLRSMLYDLRKPFLAAEEKRVKELEAIEREKLEAKKLLIASTKEEIQVLLQKGPELELEKLDEEFRLLQEKVKEISSTKIEKQQFDRLLRPLRDLVADKKEQSLLNLSDDDKKSLENLKLVLDQKKDRRQEIKNQIEIYRKALGGSNLDFEKAMQYQELAEQEKERLEKANEAIEEIEEKINQFDRN